MRVTEAEATCRRFSDLIVHNDDENGYWLLIDGRIHDVTRFLDQHPGGRTILANAAGRDATAEFQAVAHHQSQPICRMLRRFEVGTLAVPDFAHGGLATFYADCLAFADLVVDMQNTLASDLAFFARPCMAGDDPEQPGAYKTDLLLDAHRRFVSAYVGLLTRRLQALAGPRVSIDLAALAQQGQQLEAALGRLSRAHADRLCLASGTGWRPLNHLAQLQVGAACTALLGGVKRAVVRLLRAVEDGCRAPAPPAGANAALQDIERRMLAGLQAVSTAARAACDDMEERGQGARPADHP